MYYDGFHRSFCDDDDDLELIQESDSIFAFETPELFRPEQIRSKRSGTASLLFSRHRFSTALLTQLKTNKHQRVRRGWIDPNINNNILNTGCIRYFSSISTSSSCHHDPSHHRIDVLVWTQLLSHLALHTLLLLFLCSAPLSCRHMTQRWVDASSADDWCKRRSWSAAVSCFYSSKQKYFFFLKLHEQLLSVIPALYFLAITSIPNSAGWHNPDSFVSVVVYCRKPTYKSQPEQPEVRHGQ